MSPLERWKNHFSLETLMVPVSADELELICCDSTTRTISHIGIELHTCIFNSQDLQSLRRSIPEAQGFKVQVNFNSELMNCIWVKHPVTKEYLQVVNTDPTTNDLNSVQIVKLAEMKRRAASTGVLLTIQEARKRMIALTEPFLRAKTQTERRRAFKLLGVLAEDVSEAPKTPPNSKKTGARKNPRLKADTTDVASSRNTAVPIDQNTVHLSTDDDLPPVFSIVRRRAMQSDSPISPGAEQ